jgi:hypothetical protein
MKTIKINGQLTAEEREVALVYNYADKKWIMDTTVLKYYNKAKKQGWAQIAEYVYKDGAVCGGVFEAPGYAITIRGAEKRKMTDKQLENLVADDEDDEE